MSRSISISSALLIAAIAATSAVVHPSRAAAQPFTCPLDAPSDDHVRARLAWIQQHIEQDEDDVRRWTVFSTVFQGALVIANVGLLAASPDQGTVIDNTVNLIGTGLGLLGIFLQWSPLIGAGDAIRALPQSTPEERYAALRIAERRMMAGAAGAAYTLSGVNLGQAAIINIISATTLAWLNRTSAAYVSSWVGPILTVGRTLLHPTRPIQSWETYFRRHPEAGCLVPEEPPPPVSNEVAWRLAPNVSDTAGGMSLHLTF